MNVLRCTIIDDSGGVSFLTHGDALPALVAACTSNPATFEAMLARADDYYHDLSDYVYSGLAVFDEHNTRGNYGAIHKALTTLPRYRQPVFRIVDDLTREASLRAALNLLMQARDVLDDPACVLFVNKLDLVERWEVAPQTLAEIRTSLPVFETSALSGDGVEAGFGELAARLGA